jgi:large subunit ribosomal protein L22
MSKETAVVNSTFVNASFKHAVEICSFIKGRKLDSSIALLKKVEAKKQAVPIRRYKRKVPHKPGMGPGKYPVKASKAIREALESAAKNAEAKDLKREKLVVSVLEVNRAMSARRSARFRRGKIINIKVEVREA